MSTDFELHRNTLFTYRQASDFVQKHASERMPIDRHQISLHIMMCNRCLLIGM
jgi:hypothetical protein